MVNEYQIHVQFMTTVLNLRFKNGEMNQAKLDRCLARIKVMDSIEELIKLAELYSIYITLPSKPGCHD